MPTINEPGNYIVETTKSQGCENSSIRLEILQQEPDDTNWVSVGQDGDNFTIDVERLEDGRSANATIGAFFTPEGGSEMRCTNNDIIVTINASCDCDDLTITRAPYSATPVSSDGYEDAEIGYYTKDECIQDASLSVSVPSDCDWVEGLDIDNSGCFIYGTILPNTDTLARTVTVTIKYTAGGAPCTKEFTVKQAEYDPGCKCDDFSITKEYYPESNPISVSGVSNEAVADYDTNTCITIDDNDLKSTQLWLHDIHHTGSTTNGVITAIIDPSTETEARHAEITVPYKVNGKYCETKYVTVWQGGTNCECTTAMTISDSVEMDSGSTTSVTYTVNCGTVDITSVTSTDVSVATASNGDNNTIVVEGKKPGTATITIKYNVNGRYCEGGDKTITVTVNCIDITIGPEDGSDTIEWSAQSQTKQFIIQ